MVKYIQFAIVGTFHRHAVAFRRSPVLAFICAGLYRQSRISKTVLLASLHGLLKTLLSREKICIDDCPEDLPSIIPHKINEVFWGRRHTCLYIVPLKQLWKLIYRHKMSSIVAAFHKALLDFFLKIGKGAVDGG